MIRAKYWILAIILSSVCGFFLGRSTLEKETVTIARKEKTIKDTIYIPEPISIKIPDKVRLPIRPDTVTMMDTTFIIQVVDTNKIIEDYISIKDYSFNVFDDKYGTLDVKQSLQYNSL